MCKRFYDRHHRYPRGHKKRNQKEHIVRVRRSQHQAWHNLGLGSHCPYEIARIINSYFIRPDYEFVVRRKT